MPRWEPGARERMQAAALELFEHGGYARTTVEDIADRSGVTTRTFFRHFSDKREVLFGGAGDFEQRFVDGLGEAPDAPPWEAVCAAVHAVGDSFAGRHEHARRRHRVIAASPELRERELVKLASVAAAVTAALRARGVADVPALLAGQLVVAVFWTAFQQWVEDGSHRGLPELLEEALTAVGSLVAGVSGRVP